jgi:hypothetical protein
LGNLGDPPAGGVLRPRTAADKGAGVLQRSLGKNRGALPQRVCGRSGHAGPMCSAVTGRQYSYRYKAQHSEAGALGPGAEGAGVKKTKAAFKTVCATSIAAGVDKVHGRGGMVYADPGVGPGLYCLTFRIVLPQRGWFLVSNCYPYTYTDLQVCAK